MGPRKRTTLRTVGAAAALVVSLCTCSRPQRDVTVRFSLPAQSAVRAAPAAASGFGCFGLLITGPGIATLAGAGASGSQLTTDYCSYPGASSPFVAVGTQVDLELTVPGGNNRRVQVVGLDLNGAAGCPSMTVSEFMKASERGDTSVASYGGLYEVGGVVRDILQNATIEIPNEYDSGNLKDLRTCRAGNLVTGTGTRLTLEPGGKFQIQASGETGPYSYAVLEGDATVDANGVVTAGSTTTTTALVKIESAAGKYKLLPVTTYYPSVTPVAWYSGSRGFAGQGTADAAPLSVDWINFPLLSSLQGLAAVPGSGSLVFSLAAAGFNGHASVYFQGNSNYHRSNPGNVTFNAATLFLVMKPTVSTSENLLCVTQTGLCGDNVDALSMRQVSGTSVVAELGYGGNGGVTVTRNLGASTSIIDLQAFNLATSPMLSLTVNNGSNHALSGTGDQSFSLSNAGSSYLFVGSVSGPLDTRIAEVMVFNVNLTTTERDEVLAYLNAKYAVY